MVDPVTVPIDDIRPELETRKIIIASGIECHREEIQMVPFDFLRENIGDAVEIDESQDSLDGFETVRRVARYLSEEQRVRYILINVVSKRDFTRALETEGIHAIYDGHSRYGRGACFDPYTGTADQHGDQWEGGNGDENGLFRLGYPFVPVELEDIEHHQYHCTPVPVEEGDPPNEHSHPFSRHPDARRSLQRITLPEDLQTLVDPDYRSPSNTYFGLRIGGKRNILMHAGWSNTRNNPYDLGTTDLRCRVFCHFGCSSRTHFWHIVRKEGYKGWVRPDPPTDRYAYFTTAPSEERVLPYWLYYLLTYNVQNNFQPWWDSLEYAKRKTNQRLQRERRGYQVY